MKKGTARDELAFRIFLLKNKQAEELQVVKEQFHITCESLQPVNLVKNTWHELTSSSELRNGIVSNAIGLTTGYLSKKVLVGRSRNPVKKIFGALLQFAIANVVLNHSETIKSTGEYFLNRFLNYRKAKHELSEQENSIN